VKVDRAKMRLSDDDDDDGVINHEPVFDKSNTQEHIEKFKDFKME
jgi:hypothetical protein